MHCVNCDRLLSDFEATRKHAITFQFLDLCRVCFEDVKTIIPTIDNRSLMTEQDFDVDEDNATDLYTGDSSGTSLEDLDAYINYEVDSEDSRDD
jgi:hypothetical protein